MSDETEIARRRRRAAALGGVDQVQREHDRGRLTVRERIELLVDRGSFREVGTMATLPLVDVHGTVVDVAPAPYVGGLASIDGRPVVVGGEDFTVNYGAPAQHLEKLKGGFSGYIEELAHEYRLPLVLLLHGAGGDAAFADAVGFTAVPSEHSVFPMGELLEIVPVACAVLGVVGGGAGARAVASHFSVMSRPQGMMFAAGPAIVERALGRWVDKHELGGVDVHVTASGNVDNPAESELDALTQIRRFLSYLPSNVDQLPPVGVSVEPAESAGDIGDSGGDPVRLIHGIVDAESFFSVGIGFGNALVAGYARVDGRVVGVLAHDARLDAGVLDGLAADKQVRFVQTCNLFHVPIVFFVDTAGVRDDADTEDSGVLRRVVRAVEAMHRVQVPVLSVHVGRCEGLAGLATSASHRTAMRIAWPSASFGGDGVADGPAATDGPWETAENFGVEEIVAPGETRAFIADWLRFTALSNRPGPATGPQYRP